LHFISGKQSSGHIESELLELLDGKLQIDADCHGYEFDERIRISDAIWRIGILKHPGD
jgi:hypothetical protein